MACVPFLSVLPDTSQGGLACCHGYAVAAGGVEIGEVETPIFSGPLCEPDYLLVRTVRAIAGTFRVVPAAHVARVDPERRTLSLAVDRAAVASLPERLPLRHEAVA